MEEIRILVASGPFCTEFNFARGTNTTFIETTSKFEKKYVNHLKKAGVVYIIGAVFV